MGSIRGRGSLREVGTGTGRVGSGTGWGENQQSELEKHLALKLRPLRPRRGQDATTVIQRGTSQACCFLYTWEPRSPFILSRDIVLGAEDGCPARASWAPEEA